MNNTTESQILDSLLDSELDDIADLPEFVTPPAGAYSATIKGITSKQVGTHPALEVSIILTETLELSNAADTPVAPKTECSVAYMMDNEFGQGNFKKFIKPIAAALGVTSTRAAVEGAAGMEVMLVTKVRQNKEKTQNYMDIVQVQVV